MKMFGPKTHLEYFMLRRKLIELSKPTDFTRRTRLSVIRFLAMLLLIVVTTTSASQTEAAQKRRLKKIARVFQEQKVGKGELKYIHDIPVLFLQGTPSELGNQHGALVGPKIKPLLYFPKSFLKQNRMEAAWPLVVGASNMIIRNIPNDYTQELNSLVKSSKQEAGAITVANTMLELRRMGGCSTLIVSKEKSKTGGMLFGRNFDFPPQGILEKFSIVSIVKPEKKFAFISIGYPSLVGVISGMNEKGLAVATLDVYKSKDKSPKFDITGVPMIFTFRKILEECSTVEEAEKLLRKNKATTWMNLAVCDTNDSAVFELTPRTVIKREGKNGILPCTNHFRSPQLCTSKTCRRYSNLLKSKMIKKLGIDDVGKMMHSANQRSWTLQSMIFEPATLKVHVSVGNGPTSKGPYHEFDFKDLLKKLPAPNDKKITIPTSKSNLLPGKLKGK